MPAERSETSRRQYLSAASGLLTATAAGCTSSFAAGNGVEAFEHEATVELSGDGPSQPVTFTLSANGEEFTRTVEPGAELEADLPGMDDAVSVEIAYEEYLTVEVTWELPGVTFKFELEQDTWDHTTANGVVAVTDGKLSTDVDLTLGLPESTTELTAADTRPIEDGDEYDVEVEVSAKDGEMDAELNVEQEGDDDDDADDSGEDESEADEEEDDESEVEDEEDDETAEEDGADEDDDEEAEDDDSEDSAEGDDPQAEEDDEDDDDDETDEADGDGENEADEGGDDT